MKTRGIVNADGIFINIVLQVGGIKLFQRSGQVTGAVYVNTIIPDHHPGKALAVLDIHILQKGTFG
jgi:hypothetical protein